MSNKPRLHPIAHFTVPYLCFLDKEKQLTQPLPEFANESTLKALYRAMMLVRLLDTKAVNLQRTGRLGTYPSSSGQEAVMVGLGHALQPNDLYAPAYRDQGVLLQRNITIAEILSVWGGDERGNCFAYNSQDLPVCVTVAGQCLHAAGAAYAIKYRQQARAVATIVGDGGTSKGDFYEAINLAGVWKLPLVIVINNNQWAISVPRTAQSAAETLAQKGLAGGVECLQVDGNDIIAVRYAVATALEKARNQHGPTLIEAITYRLADHTTADDASRYRQPDELKQHWQTEPMSRLQHYLRTQDWWSDALEQECCAQCEAKVEQGVKDYLTQPKAKPTDIFDYLYAQLPDALVDQREALQQKIKQ